MKIDRHGRAKILTTDEIKLLFNEGFTLNPKRDRTLFAVCLYTACRITECVTLNIQDVYDSKLRVRPELVIRKGNTKGKLATRTIPVIEDLRIRLNEFKPSITRGYLFPGRHGKNHILKTSADAILRSVCQKLEIEGVSTHSFRRTALTRMSDSGVPLRHIQAISGHRTLAALERYLGVTEQQKETAISTLDFDF